VAPRHSRHDLLWGVCLQVAIIFNSSSNKGLQDISVYYLQQSFGFDDQEVGYIVVILGFGVILSQAFLLKPLIAKFQERGAIIFSIFCGLAYYIGIALSGIDGNGQKWQAYFFVGFFGSLSVLVFPAVSSLEMMNSSQEEQGVIQGALFGLQSLAQALGGFLFAALYNWGRGNGGSGPAWRGGMTAYLVGAGFQAIALVFTILIPAGASKKIYETIPDNDDFDNTTSPVSKSKKASRALGTPGK